MATSKPAAKKVAAKATPAPAPAPVEETSEVAIAEGTVVRFLGYGEGVEEADMHLTEGETYTVVGFTEAEGEDPGGDPIVEFPNPDFNPKKKESDSNPKTYQTAVLMDEIEVVGEEEGEAEEEAAAEEEVAEEEAAEEAPAPAAAKKTAAKKTAPAKQEAAAKPAAKTGKKAAPAKAEKPAKEEVVQLKEGEELPDLETEDADVVALVEGAEDGDLVSVALGLEQQAATTEFQLGGILYHIKKGRKFLEVEGGEKYAEKGGWAQFLADFFTVEYRKAQHLIAIYVEFSKAGIADASSVVAAMGWTKASRIAPLMNVDGNNPEELVTLATEQTLTDLNTTIRETVTVGATPGAKSTGGTRVQRISMKFRLEEGEGKFVESVLKTVQEQNSLKDGNQALAYIITDWATNNGMQAPAKAAPAQSKAVGKAAAKSAPAKAAPVAAKKAAPTKRVAATA